jgi:hypothetical protein
MADADAGHRRHRGAPPNAGSAPGGERPMNVRMLVMAALVLASAACSGSDVEAPPNWRTLTARRAVGREDSLRVVAKYGLGKLTLRAADPAVLYDVSVKYDAQHFRAEEHFDAVTRTLTVGADSATAELFTLRPRYHTGANDRNTKDAAMTLSLARGIPIDLTVKMGIAEGDIDLGNLWLDRARIEVTMAGATVDFSTANQHPMKSLDIQALMGGITVQHAGNANAKLIKLRGDLGGGMIDLRGAWTGDMTLDASLTLGGMKIRVPDDAGVHITAVAKLAGIGAEGFVKRGGEYYSANWETAARKVTITGTAALAGLEVGWIEP